MNIRELESSSPRNGEWDTAGQLKWHVYTRSEKAFAEGDAARDAIKSAAALKKRQKYIREKFIESLGGLPPMDTPLNAKITGVLKEDGFKIEKIIFESRPKTYVTCNMYIPDGIKKPSAAVIFLCGHHMDAKQNPQYQMVCRFLVKAGLIVFAQDPIGQGERWSYWEKSIGKTTVDPCCKEHDYAGWASFTMGDAIAKYFVHDSMRSYDYLLTRPEVDPNRIGITGNSGGGTQTTMMMLADPRPAAFAPTTFLMDRKMYMHNGGAQDQEQIWPGFTSSGLDHEDALIAVAPKPVQVQAVTSDFFPIEATRRTVGRCKRFWEMLGQPKDLRLVEDFSSHMYTRLLAQAVAEFFSEKLLGKKVTVPDESVVTIEPSLLWCTKSGQVRGEIKGARAVHEENVDKCKTLKPKLNKESIAWLKEKVYANRNECGLNPRYWNRWLIQEMEVLGCFWWPQEGIINHAHSIRDIKYIGKELPVTIALWEGGTTCIDSHIDWIRKTCRSGRAVVIADLTAMGNLMPNNLLDRSYPMEFYGVVHKLADDLIWLDDSMAAMRVYDTIRLLDAVQMWPGHKKDDIRFHTGGRYNIYPELASALDKRIAKIESVERLESFADWVCSRHYKLEDIPGFVFPGILQHLDLPDIRNK